MSGDSFWFVALPNAALIAAAAGVLYRLVMRPATATEPSPGAAATAAPLVLWGRVSFRWGLALVLAGHFLALLLPSTIRSWNAAPIRLWLLEGTGLALALWAVVGLTVVVAARLRDGGPRPAVADIAVVTAVAFLIGSGILISLLYRWGSAWGTAILVPHLWNVVTGSGDASVVGDLPWLAQAHFVSAFGLVVAFPFSRWWGVVVTGWERMVAALTAARRAEQPVGAASRAMGWGRAYGIGAVILVAATLLTVWLPSWIVQALAASDRLVQDVAGSTVWVIMLAAVLAGLRWAQRSGRI